MQADNVFSSDDSIIRLIQITDTHLFKDTTSELLGINTYQSYHSVLNAVQTRSFPYQFILATGDIVQDRTDKAYKIFVKGISQLNAPVFWLPGNHDFQPYMVNNLSQGNISNKKQIFAGNWQILMLDSQVLGVPHGYLDLYQINWLSQQLKENPGYYTLIVLHHHILPTNSNWLDQHNLRNTSEFINTLKPYKNVKGILSGHVHQDTNILWEGYSVMTTPSTCIQFKSDSSNFALSNESPGWRELSLHPDGTIETQVQRINSSLFRPSYGSMGY